MYRITRTIVGGQFDNDRCFTYWLEKQSTVRLVTMRIDPAIGGSSKEDRYYLWEQTAEVKTPKCPNSDPDLINENGVNGWATQQEAQAVIDRLYAKSAAIKKTVADANAAALNPFKIIGDTLSDAANAAGKTAKSSGPWIVVGLIAAAVIAWKVLK